MKPTADQFSLFTAILEAEPVTSPPTLQEDEPAPATPRRRRSTAAAPLEALTLLDPPPIPATPGQSFADFFVQNGRFPWIQDERKPWTYRGWLMWYRILCEEQRPDIVPPRWLYWFETMNRGKLLDHPIPRIEFSGDESERTAGFKHVQTLVDICSHGLSDFSRIDPLLDWMMWALGLSKEMPDFPETLNEKLYRTLNLEHFLTAPCDYLGAWIGASKGRWNPNAFFATPHHIVELMTQMTFGEGDHRAATVNEPCVGTGRMLLHASNHSLRLHGQDKDRTVLLACQINGALYAPWLVRPFPEEIFEHPTALTTATAAADE